MRKPLAQATSNVSPAGSVRLSSTTRSTSSCQPGRLRSAKWLRPTTTRRSTGALLVIHRGGRITSKGQARSRHVATLAFPARYRTAPKRAAIRSAGCDRGCPPTRGEAAQEGGRCLIVAEAATTSEAIGLPRGVQFVHGESRRERACGRVYLGTGMRFGAQWARSWTGRRPLVAREAFVTARGV